MNQAYADYETIAIGLYGAAAGISESNMLNVENDWAALTSTFKGATSEDYDSTYTHLLKANVDNTKQATACIKAMRLGFAMIRLPLSRLFRSTKFGAAILLVVVSFLVYARFPLRAEATPSPPPSPCETLSTQTVKSPDGKWNAVSTEVACEFGYAFNSSATYTVSLVNAANPSLKNNVFAVLDSGAVTRPKISWNGNTTLTINTIPPRDTSLQLTSFSGITLVYTYR